MPAARQPVIFVPHGGGPCFWIEFPPPFGPHAWDNLRDYLAGVLKSLPERPKAFLVVTAHWETDQPTVSVNPKPGMLYDYNGFPPHTYKLSYPAPGDPALAAEVKRLIEAAGLPVTTDGERGFDHGVFIPLLVLFPEANIPVVALSILGGYDPQRHMNIGKALAALRDDNVLIIGSGFVTHERDATKRQTTEFVNALTRVITAEPPNERTSSLINWRTLPSANAAHRFGREDHLIPLHVIVGAAGSDSGTVLSSFVFGADDSAMAAANYAFGVQADNTTEAQQRDDL